MSGWCVWVGGCVGRSGGRAGGWVGGGVSVGRWMTPSQTRGDGSHADRSYNTPNNGSPNAGAHRMTQCSARWLDGPATLATTGNGGACPSGCARATCCDHTHMTSARMNQQLAWVDMFGVVCSALRMVCAAVQSRPSARPPRAISMITIPHMDLRAFPCVRRAANASFVARHGLSFDLMRFIRGRKA